MTPDQWPYLGGGLLFCMFLLRSLLRQETGWRNLLEAARREAAEAKKEAREAWQIAAAAREETERCDERNHRLEARVFELERELRMMRGEA